MRHHFCTLFDRNYLYKGLALYNSLLTHAADFTLWILCMDDVAFELLEKLELKKAELIRLSDFEDEALLEIKPTRSVAEYCWTCTPSLPLYILKRDPAISRITYLDADLLFYDDPGYIFREADDKSIMIVEHRFPEHLKHYEVNGIYNVSIVVFRNNDYGLECLNWWRDRCNEWCFYRIEDGKMGDQKYLDDWLTRFRGVHVLKQKGVGLALWNIMRYDVRENGSKVLVDDDPLVFYHFHQFDILGEAAYDYGARGEYSLSPKQVKLVYEPYVAALEEAMIQVRGVDPAYNYGFGAVEKPPSEVKSDGVFQRLKKRLKGVRVKEKVA